MSIVIRQILSEVHIAVDALSWRNVVENWFDFRCLKRHSNEILFLLRKDSNSITFLYVIACNGIIIYSLRASAMNKCNIHDRNRFANPDSDKIENSACEILVCYLINVSG